MLKNKLTISEIQAKKISKTKFTMVTVYDFPMASIVEKSSIDMILIGDSLGKIIQGFDNTMSVSLEDIIYHLKIVRRGAPNKFIVADMPFIPYQIDIKEVIGNAQSLIINGADCVKIEGGAEVSETIKAVVQSGIPVIAHIGITSHTNDIIMGNCQERTQSSMIAQKLITDAKALEEAGAFSIVLQFIPNKLTAIIDKQLHIPTIGYGAGPDTSGQNLNAYGLLGILDKSATKYVKQYASLGEEILRSFNKWNDETEKGIFPASEHCFIMEYDEFKNYSQ